MTTQDWTTGWEPAPRMGEGERRVARTYQGRVESQIAAGGRALDSALREVTTTSGLTAAAESAWTAAASPILAASLAQAETEALAYLALYDIGPEVVPAPDPDLDSPVLTAAIRKARWYSSQGMGLREATAQTSRVVQGWHAGDYQAAMRRGMDMSAGTIGGYRKVASMTACDWCLQVAERVYYRSVPFHADCRCAVVPIPRSSMSSGEAAYSDSVTLYGRGTFRGGSTRTSSAWAEIYDQRRAEIIAIRERAMTGSTRRMIVR